MTGITQVDAIATATEQVLANIDALLNPIEQILRGEKPTKYPKALRAQMERMSQDDFLIESVDSYLVRPDEIPSAALNHAKGMTAINPVSSALRERRDNILAVTRPQSIYNFKILGWDQFYRQRLDDAESDPVGQADQSDALILTRSDLHGLRQMLHILRAKLNDDERVAMTCLIIQDSHDFWVPVLEHLDLGSLKEKIIDLDLHITHFPGAKDVDAEESTIHALREMGLRANRRPARSKLDTQIEPGDRLYVCSGSAHKPIEIGKIFTAMKAKVDVMALNSQIDFKPREAEEDNHSLEGNNYQKMLETRKRIVEDYETSVLKLCPSDRGPESTWFMFDDRAMGFEDERIMRTKAFAAAMPLMNPYPHKLMPGAELASVFKNFSRKKIFQEMLAGAQQEIYAETGEWASTKIVDTACYIMIRMDWLLDEQPKYISTFGNTRSIALTQPHPFKPDASFTEYYSAPLAFNTESAFDDAGAPKEDIRTKQEIPHYLETASEMYLALRTMADLTGIDRHALQVMPGFNAAAKAPQQKLYLATQHTLFPHINGHGTSHMHRVIKGALNGTWKFLKDRNSQYDITRFIKPNVKGVVPVRCGTAHRDMAEKALTCLANLYRDADAIVLTRDNPKLAQIPGIKWLKLLMCYSLMVGKQVDNRTIKPKFFGILNEADGSWDDARGIFEHLNATPLLMNYYEHLVQDTDNKGDLKTALRTHSFTYRRPDVIRKNVAMKPDSVPVPDDMYRVTIYCSASLGSETSAYNEALAFTENLAERGFALIQGGGREGVMFATAEGVHRFIRKFRDKYHHNPRAHVASEQCHDTYEREGGWHDENHFARIHELIEQRMANLMNTDAEILMAGGAGSVQEIAASLLMRAWRVTPATHRPLIIVNQMVDGRAVFDPLITMLTPAERAELNVHVVSNTAEAMPILEKSRRDLRKVLGPNSLFIPDGEEVANEPQGLKIIRLIAS